MNILPVKVLGSDNLAYIDEEDGPRVNAHTWRVRVQNNKMFPVARIDGSSIRLSRFIMDSTPNDGMFVVPENGDAFDCRKANLTKIPAPFDTSKSWDSRNALSAKLPPFERLPKNSDEDCNHPALIASTEPGDYTCLRCDQRMRAGEIYKSTGR